MNPVKHFLKKNGFKRISNNEYGNEKCCVEFSIAGWYVVVNMEGDTMYSNDNNIYWLIGVLTYYGYMDKDYIK